METKANPTTAIVNGKPARATATRVAINTIIIYLQKFSSAALALVTTPLLLRVLGVEDFGLYALTTGFVGAITFFTWSVSSATQRFIAIALGEKNKEKLLQVIQSSMFIHLVYGVIIFMGLLLFNFFFAHSFLKIPPHRLEAASVVMIMVSAIAFLSIISIPFLGMLRAYENFFILAVSGVTESLLKLGVAFLLLFTGTDKLVTYAALMLGVSLVAFLINAITVHLRYHRIDMGLLQPHWVTVKKMMVFIGWTLLGALAVMSRNQGVAVVLNLFFGVVANAAYGVALQINYAINILAQGVTGALTPVLLKSAGEKNYDKMLYSMKTMSRMAFYSIAVFSIPLFFEMETVLTIWLKNVPEGTVLFARATLVLVLVCILSSGMQAVLDALGKVKSYNIMVSTLLLLNLPLAIFLFKMGFSGVYIIVTAIVLEFCSYFVRLFLLHKYIGFSGFGYLVETVKEIGTPVLVTTVILYALSVFVKIAYIKLILSFGLSFILFPLMVYYWSMDQAQKDFVNKTVLFLKAKYFSKNKTVSI
jgi:O-antigen/teichoic acid export membrane protein